MGPDLTPGPQLCTHKSFLADTGNHMGCEGSNPDHLHARQTNALLSVLLLWTMLLINSAPYHREDKEPLVEDIKGAMGSDTDRGSE